VRRVAALLLVLGVKPYVGPDAGKSLMAFALFTTAVIFNVAAIANNNLQDLKTGQLVDATPWKQQVALIIGVIAGALVIPPVLDLVNQAAEIFNGMEKHARETDARARVLCASLTEKLQLAEKQRDASERARREVVDEFNCKLQDIARALQQAQSRIVHAEEKAVAAEFRAQAVEVRLQKANRDLAAVEEAIRTRLL